MRYSTFSNFAILASSLLVKDVFASPIDMRALVTDNVVITEEVVVIKAADGSLKTGAPDAVGTATIPGSPAAVASDQPASIAPEAPTASAPAPSALNAAFFQHSAAEQPASAAPAPSEAPVYVAAEPAASPAYVEPATPSPSSAPVYVPPPTPEASTSASAAPVATGSAPSSGSSGAKRGIAYNDASLLSAFTSEKSCSWAYNWGSSTSEIPTEFEYVPMLWGNGQHADGWSSFAEKAIAAGSTHLLGFNEPDLPAQANIEAGQAASDWMSLMEPFAGKAKLVSPAVTNGGSPMGLSWMSSFMSACSSCQIDAVAIHWYNGGDAAAFKDYVQKAYTAGGNRPLWITEFQAPGSDAEQSAFLEEVLPWLDSQDIVERYAYFMASEGSLVSGGTLSTLGKAFASTA